MVAFDASTRETCTVRETRTNTPLQALDLLNDVTYVEASRKLAERVLQMPASSPSERIERAFRLVLSRRPTAAEARILRAKLRPASGRASVPIRTPRASCWPSASRPAMPRSTRPNWPPTPRPPA